MRVCVSLVSPKPIMRGIGEGGEGYKSQTGFKNG